MKYTTEFSKALGAVPSAHASEIKQVILSRTGWTGATLLNKLAGRTPVKPIEREFLISLFKDYGVDYKTGLPIFTR